MNSRRLILRSLSYHWRTHLGVVAGSAVGAAVLIGALVVGDSVRHTLQAQAMARIGQVDLALLANDRLFQADLSDRLAGIEEGAHIAPVLQLRAVASTIDGNRSAQKVNVMGIDARFLEMAPGAGATAPPTDDQLFINERLAQRLDVGPGDRIVIRVEKPSAMPRESVLGTVEDISLGLRVEVARIIDEGAFGRYGLKADPLPPHNAFVSIDWLQGQLGIPGRANVLLVDDEDARLSIEAANAAVRKVFDTRDAQLDFLDVHDSGAAERELRSDRIFIDPIVAETLANSPAPMTGFLTYFVNAIEYGDRSTPYSMVTALGPFHDGQSAGPDSSELLDLADDEIVVNEWLASDLACGPGDEITLRYYVLDENERLVESETPFTVRAVVPIEGLAADRSLMPEFPGIADAENSRDWQPGIPIDTNLIRDTDEAYWDTYRGTPKAFVSLTAGKAMWGNRYGAHTAVRFHAADEASIAGLLHDTIDPASLGFFFMDVRTPAILASKATTDFGGLFLGLSFFLIFAALLLTALLFVFNIDQRAREIGTLLSLGFKPKQVARLLMGEGLALATIGSVLGILIGVFYTRMILFALAGVWQQAIASTSIEVFIAPMTLAIGGVASIIAAGVAMRLTLGRSVRTEPVRLLGGDVSSDPGDAPKRAPILSMILASAAMLSAIIIALTADMDRTSAAMAFFAAGSLLLVGGIIISRVVFLHLGRMATKGPASINHLAIRNSARRISRSLTTVSLLACGVFLVVAMAANRLDSTRDAEVRSSGTGGFAMYGESTLPVLIDLNTQRGRDVFGLTAAELEGVSFVSLRVREGDDASCLNLNTAQNPRLMGVDPDQLDRRGAFTFVKHLEEAATTPAWSMLDAELASGAIPAIADDKSVMWAMHKAVGDTIEYTDEQGRPFKVAIVGTIANSILQGSLIVHERRFRELFPAQQGHRAFLIDAAAADRSRVGERLQRALSDVGLELTTTAARLADFNAVQNTYLAIFQLLGGLGLLLGSIGLGIVVVRNVLERRSELALLRALGFNIRTIRRLIRNEHVFILLLGLLWGIVSALIAVLPALRSATAEFPVGFTLALLVLLTVNGILWVGIATRFAVSGPLAAALREE